MNKPTHDWLPSASIQHLKKRSDILRQTREFFYNRDVWEAETPLLCHFGVTDCYIENLEVQDKISYKTNYLQTSPEFAMKRLLAAGSGAIFYLGKAFRQGESGRFHNPEFTLLEWYRVGFDDSLLMDEISELLQVILHCTIPQKISYHTIFKQYLNINPHQVSVDVLKNIALEKNLIDKDIEQHFHSTNDYLDLLFSLCIQPHLGQAAPVFIYHYPASQAMLAKIDITQADYPVARRFECFYKGIELANGFYELQDSHEQQQRFSKDNAMRAHLGLTEKPIDHRFLDALNAGLPDCAGVALGMDRLIMLALGVDSIAEVLSFNSDRA